MRPPHASSARRGAVTARAAKLVGDGDSRGSPLGSVSIRYNLANLENALR
jgi:hypothetical protein